MKLVDALLNNDTITENGMPTHSTSGNALVDLFFYMGGARQASCNEFIGKLALSWAFDPLLTRKAVFHLRNPRGGMGERKNFRRAIHWMAKYHPDELYPNLHLIPKYGRWDDLLVCIGTALEDPALYLIYSAIKNGDSLAGKWMPRDNKKYGKIAEYLAEKWGMSPRRYRKFVVSTTRVVETQMCNQEWTLIEYSHIPSVAINKYHKAWPRHDQLRYSKWLQSVEKGESKINAGAIFPHTIIKDWVGGYGSRTPEEIRQKEAQWKSLPDYHINGNVLGICDVSGSMEGEPLLVCIALGIYLAQHTKGDFHNYFITFSEKPKLQKLEGNNLFDNVSAMQHAEWGMSTNLESVFELLLKRAVKHSIPPDEMPNTLVIFSDMQFNQAIREEDHNALEMMKTRYKDAGYVTPNIIFWNLRASNGVPAKFTEDGIALVSGFSPSTMETILSGDINPVGVLLKTLEKYGDVQ
jgi:hypothetical protein